MSDSTSDIIGIELDATIIAGKDLVAKDGSGLFGMGKKTSSDPYIRLLLDGTKMGETSVQKKTLKPVWNESFKKNLAGRAFNPNAMLIFAIFDKDKMSADDPMGEVIVPLSSLYSGHVVEKWFPVTVCKGCSNATGSLHLKLSCAIRKAVSLRAHESMAVNTGFFAVGLGWDVMRGGGAIDLDTSCVAVSFQGKILEHETVYFAQLQSRSGAITHTGDEKEGDEDLGSGDDEIIMVDLPKVPAEVCALYFIATVASEGHTFADVKSAKMRLVDWHTGSELCRYMPAMSGAHTALFLCRLAREKPNAVWRLSTIGEHDHTARDWGTLVPEIKSYTTDIVKGLKVDISERVAIMRKGGVMRMRDYASPEDHNGLPSTLVLGLAWDVTDGVSIDLDASVIMLDANLKCIDLVFFGKLQSSDMSIQHGGDEREGDAEGDDEKIFLRLGRVHPAVSYLGFVINSYSGQELDDVKDASCHLFDGKSHRDLMRYQMTSCKTLDKHTALLVGMLYRDDETSEWAFEAIAEAAHGRMAQDNIDELQAFIKRKPRTKLAPPRPPPGPGNAMLMWREKQHGVARALGGAAQFVRTASGRLLGAGQQPTVAVAIPIAHGTEVKLS
jgi:tellurium resistance protein TerZ